MSVKIHLATTQIYGFYWRNYRHIDNGTEVLIAENKDNGMSLYLTSEGYYPQLVIYNPQNRPMVWRIVRTSEECNLAAVFLISNFLISGKLEQGSEGEEKPQEQEHAKQDAEEVEVDEEQKIMDMIYQREDELEMAMSDFLAKAFCEDDREIIKEAYGKDIVKDTLDDFLQYLYDQHGISVYRPTLITDDESGEEVLAEFPYGWFDKDEGEDNE